MQNLEELLAQNDTVEIFPEGHSMHPMFWPGRDSAVLQASDGQGVSPGDVLLYRRDSGMLVLHRLWKVKSDGLYLVGDNQTQPEGPISPSQVKGILVAFVRKGKRISVKNPVYKMAAGLWLVLRPVRDPIKRPLAFVKKVLKMK